jgi:drug/metabolite transporter (DMT)-like permease
MTLPAFLLVVIAAVLHACWNLAAKKASGNIGVFWLGLCFASALLLPVVWLSGLPLEPAGVPYIVATALIHTAYFSLLAASYRHGEMSVVYPLARGSGVAGTALVAAIFLGEPASVIGTIGILSVTAGILLLGLRELVSRGTSPHSCVLALLVGVTIVGYSVVDKLGVGHIHPVVYITGLVTGAALFLAPYVLLRYKDECRDAWAKHKGLSAWVGLGVVATYLLVLFAFQMGSVSYVVAVRELSIVVVAVLSVTVLQEPLTLPRCLSTTAILVGVVLVKLA